MILNIYLYIFILFILIKLSESRRSLRNYMVSNQYSSQYKQNQYFIYDQSEKDLIYFTESSLLFLPFSNYRLNNLILYPSNQIIASIENIRLLNNSKIFVFNIFDNK